MSIRWLRIVTGAGLVLALAAACTSGDANTIVPVATVVPTQTSAPPDSEGVLFGSVTIGPLCPVEPCPREIGDTYSSRELQLQSESASGILVPLQPDGTFRATVPTGEYVVTISNCEFLGCFGAPPVTVVIRKGETTNLSIDIDTGIRSVARPGTAYTRLVDQLSAAGAVAEAGPAPTSSIFDAPVQVTP